MNTHARIGRRRANGSKPLAFCLALALLLSALSFPACGATGSQNKPQETPQVSVEDQNAEKYRQAEEMLSSGDYAGAIRAFEALGDYRDSAQRASQAREAQAAAELEAKNARAYEQAENFLSEENYAKALAAFEELGDYRDSAERAQAILLEHPGFAYQEGDTVFFGSYEQDNDSSDGKESVAWQVLAIEENRLLLISDKILETRPYNKYHSSVTWETCSLRAWLNGEFLNEAFSEEEQTAIPAVTVKASASRDFDTDPGNDTEDRVFVLGIGELQKYFQFGGDCMASAYAKAQGCYVDHEGYTRWWLRTPGETQRSVLTGSGGVIVFAYSVDYDTVGVRPALWVDLIEADDPFAMVKKALPTVSQEPTADLRAAEVGSLITFGSYEQDNNSDNGSEAISWLVLAKEDNRLFVVSEKALDWRPYNEGGGDVTWESCSLRAWLNGDFLNEAFSEEEQARIPTVPVTMDRNPFSSTDPGSSTQDKVFLLSLTEFSSLLETKDVRMCFPTEYTRAQVAKADSIRIEKHCWWWLRTPGSVQSFAMVVRSAGSTSSDGHGSSTENGVRPALWIDLS